MLTGRNGWGWLRIGATLAVVAAAFAAPAQAVVPRLATTTSASTCPSASVGGAAVGRFTVGAVSVPIKRAAMSAAGVLDPPPSALIASVVTDFQPLKATSGSTVILWHSRYGAGCNGTLNVLMHRRIGDQFSITDGAGTTRAYAISAMITVPKGHYKASWFRATGPRQLSLITCTDLVNGVFLKNLVILAVPA